MWILIFIGMENYFALIYTTATAAAAVAAPAMAPTTTTSNEMRVASTHRQHNKYSLVSSRFVSRKIKCSQRSIRFAFVRKIDERGGGRGCVWNEKKRRRFQTQFDYYEYESYSICALAKHVSCKCVSVSGWVRARASKMLMWVYAVCTVLTHKHSHYTFDDVRNVHRIINLEHNSWCAFNFQFDSSDDAPFIRSYASTLLKLAWIWIEFPLPLQRRVSAVHCVCIDINVSIDGWMDGRYYGCYEWVQCTHTINARIRQRHTISIHTVLTSL